MKEQVIIDALGEYMDAIEEQLKAFRDELRTMKAAMPQYRGVWNRADEYARNSIVTDGGTLWYAREKTTDRPGKSDAWVLMHKSHDGGRS